MPAPATIVAAIRGRDEDRDIDHDHNNDDHGNHHGNKGCRGTAMIVPIMPTDPKRAFIKDNKYNPLGRNATGRWVPRTLKINIRRRIYELRSRAEAAKHISLARGNLNSLIRWVLR